jgi:hypothetical protein
MFYKKLSFDNVELISKKILAVIPEDRMDQKAFRDIDPAPLRDIPELWHELGKIGLGPENLETAHTITIPMNGYMPPHIDSGIRGGVLNWPVMGCEETTTVFFELKDKNTAFITEKTPDMQDYFMYRDSEVVEVDHVDWENQPVILDVHAIHSVRNRKHEKRVTVSLRFDRELL